MLRHPFQDLRAACQQLSVSFFRTVFDPREKQFLIKQEPLKNTVLNLLFYNGRRVQHMLEILSCNDLNNAGLNTFYRVQAGVIRFKAFYRRNGLPFKEELKSHIFPLIVKPKSHTAFFNKKRFF